MRQPQKFGKYQLLERIAVGGMAEVFVAKAFGVEGFERLLAIKKILPTMGEDAEFISMFVDEARIAVQLSHANIVQVLELGKHDDNLYIAMEYISGRDLRQVQERFRKQKKPMPIPQACLIVAEVCEALDYAHRKKDARGVALGIVHRDVSPQNVLVSFEGEVKLIDFGIAKAESRLQKTQAGILKGKFSYMSPEQVRGHGVDGRSDVFACGILLWEMLCGEKLFSGDSDFAILEKVRNGVVPPPRSVAPHLPEALEKVVLKALHADVSQRYQTASELHDDLMRFTVVGDVMYGSRQMAEWVRGEFRAEHDKEQARLRSWLQIGEEAEPEAELTPIDPIRKKQVDAFLAAKAVAGDFAITPQDPFPATFAQSVLDAQGEATQVEHLESALPPAAAPGPKAAPPEELPTMKMDGDELVRAEKAFAARAAAGAAAVEVEASAAASSASASPAAPASVPPAVASSAPAARKPTPPSVAVARRPPPSLDGGRVVAPASDAAKTTDVVKAAPSPQTTQAVPAAAQGQFEPFDLSDERTGAVRAHRATPMSRTTKEQLKVKAQQQKARRKTALLVAVPLALLALAGLGYAMLQGDEESPGKLVVTASPSVPSELFIDGKSAGQLPYVRSIAAGRHKLEVRADNYKPFSTAVTVPAGGRPVEVEAQLVGDGPMEVENVVLKQPKPAEPPPAAAEPVTQAAVEEEPARPPPAKKKHWWNHKEKAVAVAKPVEPPPQPVQKAPEPQGARLRVVTDPPGAEVTVDGKLIGKSPITTGPLSTGSYHPVVATLDGYTPAKRAARVEDGNLTEMAMTLSATEPQVAEAAPVPPNGVGYLTAATKPTARLTIDGRDTGRWTPVPPANPIALPAGDHSIIFETADGRKLEEQVTVEAGKTSRLIRSVP